jgi:hypothetical protein
MQLFEQVVGALLMLLILLDVFLTVLYARADAGIISPRVSRFVWLAFKKLCKPFTKQRERILSFCGPTILVMYVLVWAFLLAVGAGLVIHPKLGTSVRATSEASRSDLITAIYAGGSSIAVVGVSDYSPETVSFRILFLFNSLVGLSMISLTLTYLMQVYSALNRRNVFGLDVQLGCGEKGDAAELVARLGPNGKFEMGYANLSQLAHEMTQAKESHHFYPVLFYFRFREPAYAIPRFTLVSLDAVALIRTALDDDEYAWLKQSGAVAQLDSSTRLLLETVWNTFLRGVVHEPTHSPDPKTRDLWHRRYFAALRRLRQAGIRTIADEQAGVENYVNLRSEWNGYVSRMGTLLAYSPEEIDPVGTHPESSDEREEFQARVRSAYTSS